MPCATPIGESLEFGITDDEAGLTTQSTRVTRKSDKATARDNCGTEVTVAYYNPTADISIEGLSASTAQCGAVITLTGSLGQLTGKKVILDEVSIEKSNTGFVKTSIKATQYGGISV